MGTKGRRLSWHPEALRAQQKRVLLDLGRFMSQRRFYMGGGTAIAIQLGHRRSLDFDWFTGEKIDDPMQLAASFRDEGIQFVTGQIKRGTLHGTISGIRVSFLEYRYSLLEPKIIWKDYGCPVASLDDLACMKLSAIAQRGSKKDFLDVYALAREHRPLQEMLLLYQQKYNVEDIAPVLYGLAYFDDADKERTPTMLWRVDWKTVKRSLRSWLKEMAG